MVMKEQKLMWWLPGEENVKCGLVKFCKRGRQKKINLCSQLVMSLIQVIIMLVTHTVAIGT